MCVFGCKPTYVYKHSCFFAVHTTFKPQAANTLVKKQDNPSFLEKMFIEYVHTGNYRKQFKTAMALFNLVPCNLHYFWAIMSIVMQVRDIYTAIQKILIF